MKNRKKTVLRTSLFLGNLTLLGGSSTWALFELRANNLRMTELREAVISADKSGTNVYEALSELREYVSLHMNATPPDSAGTKYSISLAETYARDKKAEENRVSNARVALANEATSYCESTVRNVQLSVRAECVSQYIAQRPIAEKQIIADLYRYDFASPRWTPDLAGWLIVVSFFLGLTLLVQVVSAVFVRLIIRK